MKSKPMRKDAILQCKDSDRLLCVLVPLNLNSEKVCKICDSKYSDSGYKILVS